MASRVETTGAVDTREALPHEEVQRRVGLESKAQRTIALVEMDGYRQAEQNMKSLEQQANAPISVETLIQRKDTLLTKEDVEKLPTLRMAFRQGAPGKGGGSEHERLNTIQKRLRATVALTASSARNTKKRSGQVEPYFPAVDTDGMIIQDNYVWRRRLEDDLVWLNHETRTGDDLPDDDNRKMVFSAYSDLLAKLVALHAPKNEEWFVEKHNSILGAQKMVQQYCRDPDAVKNATRFAVLVAAGALLTLMAVMDFRNKKLSLSTLVLLGGVVLLMQNGSKFNFVGEKQFSELIKEGVNGNDIKKLYAFSKGRPAAFNHLVRVMDECNSQGKPITEETIKELMHPTKRQGGREVPDGQKAVPEDIARLFLGKTPGYVAGVLKSLRATAGSKDRGTVIAFADAVSKKHVDRKDLPTASS